MREPKVSSRYRLETLWQEAKEGWLRLKHIVLDALNHPSVARNPFSSAAAIAYRQALRRWFPGWLFRLFVVFLLVGLVRFFWHIWGKIFDVMLGLLGF